MCYYFEEVIPYMKFLDALERRRIGVVVVRGLVLTLIR